MSLNFDRFTARINRWLSQQQSQALEQAYRAAQAIQALEEQYFQGGKIADHTSQSKTVFDYVKSLRDRQLLQVRVNLVRVQLGGFLFNHASLNPESISPSTADPQTETAPRQPLSADVLAKLNFIESVVGKYRESENEVERWITTAPVHPEVAATAPGTGDLKQRSPAIHDSGSGLSVEPAKQLRFLKHRFLDFKAEREPDYEQRVVQELRQRRQQNKIAVRWLLLLLLLPIVIQIVVKNLVFEPVLGNYSDKNPTRVELNQEIQERFFAEFTALKERLEISQLLGTTPELDSAQQRERLQAGAVELWREAREQELDGLKNVLSDGVALLSFAGLVYFNRDRIAAIRSFSNRTFLGLSDPAKVFLFILVTDMFVGFHSAEGWEVLLESVARHFGVPESRAAINTFIATVPVVLDSCIKFWIFSYLTRYSPSASAIYERMNT